MNAFAEKCVTARGIGVKVRVVTFLRLHAGTWVTTSDVEDAGGVKRQHFDYAVRPYVDLGYVERRKASGGGNSGFHWEFSWVRETTGLIPIPAPGGADNHLNVRALKRAGLTSEQVVLVDTPEKMRTVPIETVRREAAPVQLDLEIPENMMDPPHPPPVTFDSLDATIDRLRASRVTLEEEEVRLRNSLHYVEREKGKLDADIAALTRAAEILIERG